MVSGRNFTFVACRMPFSGATCITGDVYGKEERELVKAIYKLDKKSVRTVHVYPATETNGRVQLSNWDHEFNPMSPFEINTDDIRFYFVTEQHLEIMFGMDVDGDSIFLIPQSDFIKCGLTDKDVDEFRRKELENHRKRFEQDHQFMLHKCGLPAYINNAVELAIESGLVVQPEKEVYP